MDCYKAALALLFVSSASSLATISSHLFSCCWNVEIAPTGLPLFSLAGTLMNSALHFSVSIDRTGDGRARRQGRHRCTRQDQTDAHLFTHSAEILLGWGNERNAASLGSFRVIRERGDRSDLSVSTREEAHFKWYFSLHNETPLLCTVCQLMLILWECPLQGHSEQLVPSSVRSSEHFLCAAVQMDSLDSTIARTSSEQWRQRMKFN